MEVFEFSGERGAGTGAFGAAEFCPAGAGGYTLG